MNEGIFKRPTLTLPTQNGRSLSATLRALHEQQQLAGRCDARRPYLPGRGIRQLVGDPESVDTAPGSGFSDFVLIEPEFCIRITDVEVDHDLESRFPGENWLKLDIWVSGRTSLVFPRFGQVDFEGRWCFAHLHNEGVDKGEWVDHKERCVLVTLYCGPGILSRVLEDDVDQLPCELRKFALDGAAAPYFEILPVTAAMSCAVLDLIGNQHVGRLRAIFVEAKAKELFALIADALIRGEQRDSNGDRKFRRSEIRRLHEVRDLICSDLTTPPRIENLCRRAAMNQQKLQQGFKQLFGRPIFEFGQTVRLEKARELLERHELTVTQVAMAVGYEYSNNFSTAFKRHYGISPKAYQMKYAG
jgi:AraC-like DNA-binding protein